MNWSAFVRGAGTGTYESIQGWLETCRSVSRSFGFTASRPSRISKTRTPAACNQYLSPLSLLREKTLLARQRRENAHAPNGSAEIRVQGSYFTNSPEMYASNSGLDGVGSSHGVSEAPYSYQTGLAGLAGVIKGFLGYV